MGSKLCCSMILLAALLAGCASRSNGPRHEADAPQARTEWVNDFPTQARVEYVFQCMREHGGQNYDNLYHCSCKVDELAKRMRYQEYAKAVVFKNLKSMPGEQGGVFRDPPQSRLLRDELTRAETEAEHHCFIK